MLVINTALAVVNPKNFLEITSFNNQIFNTANNYGVNNLTNVSTRRPSINYTIVSLDPNTAQSFSSISTFLVNLTVDNTFTYSNTTANGFNITNTAGNIVAPYRNQKI